MDAPQPKYVKNADGYCYGYNAALLKKEGFEAWDGDVDAKGYAVDRKPAAKAASKQAAKVASKPADPVKGD